jgi:hypothetical protein
LPGHGEFVDVDAPAVFAAQPARAEFDLVETDPRRDAALFIEFDRRLRIEQKIVEGDFGASSPNRPARQRPRPARAPSRARSSRRNNG